MDFMTYNDFKKNVLKNIRDYLPDEFSDTSIAINEVQKEGGLQLDGLSIKDPQSNISPVIYLNQYYAEYVASGSLALSEPLQKIANDFMSHRVTPEKKSIMYPEMVDQSRIILQLINLEANKNYLKDKMYDQIGEFAAVYKLYAGEDSDGIKTAPITKGHFKKFFACQGLKNEDLYDLAMENTTRLFPPEFVSLNDLFLSAFPDDEMLNSMCSMAEDTQLYVVTNKVGIYGATMALNEDVMKRVEEKLGENFLVFPSSVHEILVRSRDAEFSVSAEEGNSIISCINMTEVAPEERLSNQLYVFNSKERRLELASEFEKREKEKDVKIERNDTSKSHRCL